MLQPSAKVAGKQFASTQATYTSCGRQSLGFVKKTTRDKVECAATGLVNAIFPAYMDTTSNSFKSAMSGMETFGLVKKVSEALHSTPTYPGSLQTDTALVVQCLRKHAMLSCGCRHCRPCCLACSP